MNTPNHISVSSAACYRACPRQYYISRVVRLRKVQTTEPLRMGGVWAEALEAVRDAKGDPVFAATIRDEGTDWQAACLAEGCAAIDERYAERPDWADPLAWQYEQATLRALLAGYIWRYTHDDIRIERAEVEFAFPLRNPATGRPSRLFHVEGRVDALGGGAIVETKLLGKDLSPDADWWARLRYDSQLSTYMLASSEMGWNCDHIVYDCTRKPTIKPREIPELDSDGLKVYLDANGQRALNKNGSPRQSPGEGLTLQARPETPAEWGERLLADITERPDYYYARREIARTDDVLRDHAAELWQVAQAIHQSDRNGWWYRNVSFGTCDFCDYAGPCLSGVEVSRETAPPVGFMFEPVEEVAGASL